MFRFSVPTLCLSFALSGSALSLALLSAPASAQTPGDTAFQQSFRLDVPDASGFSFMTFEVPAGKRLVIRYLAVSADLPSGQRFTSGVQAMLRGVAADFPQAYTIQPNGDGTDSVVSNQPVTIQADGGTTIYFQVFRRIPRGAIRVFFAVSGDLVAMP